METKEKVPSYDMYSKAGDRACHSLVKKLVAKIGGRTRVTKEQLDALIGEGIKKIAQKHGEVNDTEPEGIIQESINKALEGNGYSIRVSRWEW